MYQKILITTDGSAVSQHTACAGVKFAQQMGAEVLVLFVAPEYQYPVYVEIIPPSYPSEEEYVAQMRRMGEEHMGSIMRAAEGCGQLLLGSVTNKVLSQTTKPVLVHRLIREPGT